MNGLRMDAAETVASRSTDDRDLTLPPPFHFRVKAKISSVEGAFKSGCRLDIAASGPLWWATWWEEGVPDVDGRFEEPS